MRKLGSTFNGVVRYTIHTEQGALELGSYIGRGFGVRATGVLSCVACGRTVDHLIAQGLCQPCASNAPQASLCIVRPELCRGHLGLGRDPAWELEHHVQEHVVYLSHTNGLKVGVTRSTQLPTRWIDQGATAALIIGRTPYRQLAGLMEVDLKRAFADRTNWRAMLRVIDPDPEALMDARTRAMSMVRHDLRDYLLNDEEVISIHYPVLAWPPRLRSVHLARTPAIGGRLMGIKGQYLIWESGHVLNVRNHAGYHVLLTDGRGSTAAPDLFTPPA